jgi:hypothetical protein
MARTSQALYLQARLTEACQKQLIHRQAPRDWGKFTVPELAVKSLQTLLE